MTFIFACDAPASGYLRIESDCRPPFPDFARLTENAAPLSTVDIDVIYDKGRHLCGAMSSIWRKTSTAKADIYARQGRPVMDVSGTSSMLKDVIFGQERHLWTARWLRGKPILGRARVPPWAVVSTADIALAQQHGFAALDTNL
jgi:hypothetical protein